MTIPSTSKNLMKHDQVYLKESTYQPLLNINILGLLVVAVSVDLFWNISVYIIPG